MSDDFQKQLKEAAELDLASYLNSTPPHLLPFPYGTAGVPKYDYAASSGLQTKPPTSAAS
jgi:hypothetical protein